MSLINDIFDRDLDSKFDKLVSEAITGQTIPADILQKVKDKCNEIIIKADQASKLGVNGCEELIKVVNDLYPLMDALKASFSEFERLPYIENVVDKFVTAVSDMLRSDVEEGIIDVGTNYSNINVMEYINDIIANNINGLGDVVDKIFMDKDASELDDNVVYDDFVGKVLRVVGANSDGFLSTLDRVNLSDMFNSDGNAV
jgi:hypothetical protein